MATTAASLARGSRLIHIGPHKTGSTALQSMCHHARAALLEQGARYVGQRRHEARAVRWVTGRPVAGADSDTGARRWRRVVDELTAPSQHRRLMSSEFFSDASDETIASIVEQLSAEALHIAITLRPLAAMLPSQYQQAVQRQAVRTYDSWLATMLPATDGLPTAPHFWVKHRHDQLVRRWGRFVGEENVVVIVVDPEDRGLLPNAFEQLLGLRPGTIAAGHANENRSLTAVEAELLRRFNHAFKQEGLDEAHYVRLVGALKRQLKSRVPEPDEPRLRTPDWAVERANRFAHAMAADISRSGAQVVGDLGVLSAVPTTALPAVPPAPGSVDVDIAVRFALGLAKATAKQ